MEGRRRREGRGEEREKGREGEGKRRKGMLVLVFEVTII